MPPLRGIDRGLNGEILKNLWQLDQGSRVVIVNANYDIPSGSQIFEYGGDTSADALKGVVSLLVAPGAVGIVDIATPAEDVALGFSSEKERRQARRGTSTMLNALGKVMSETGFRTEPRFIAIDDKQAAKALELRLQDIKLRSSNKDFIDKEREFFEKSGLSKGFSTVVNNSKDGLFIRTPDTLPYACATFIVGHAQTGE